MAIVAVYTNRWEIGTIRVQLAALKLANGHMECFGDILTQQSRTVAMCWFPPNTRNIGKQHRAVVVCRSTHAINYLNLIENVTKIGFADSSPNLLSTCISL